MRFPQILPVWVGVAGLLFVLTCGVDDSIATIAEVGAGESGGPHTTGGVSADAAGTPMWEDDLEGVTTLIGLLPADASRFTQLQTEQGGVCALETRVVHSGSNSVKCFTAATGSAKADLGRQDASGEIPGQPAPPHFGQRADQEVWAETWFYVLDAGNCEGLFLWDIEESAANNGGLRIHCKSDPDSGVDYVKMNSEFGPSFQPDPPFIQFPFEQWVRVRVYVRFHTRHGIVRIWVNDALVLDQMGQTARRRKSIYDSIQWGATINSSDRPQTVYFDDVKIWNTDPGWSAAPPRRIESLPHVR
jgi:hypothetical protein